MIKIQTLDSYTPINERPIEIVERKGIGHPDTLIDGIMEEISRDLSKEYIKETGMILHHNVDKGQICGGATNVKFGGGDFEKPVFVLLGGRASSTERIDPSEIAYASAIKYIKKTTRFLRQPNFQLLSKISHGAPELISLIERKVPKANDTSICVGFAPQSKLERIVLETERKINSKSFKAKYPEVGEDVKILGVRCDKKIYLTVAAAFVSRFVL